MRIGLITGEFPPQQGGVGAYTRILGAALADAGHDVFVLSTANARSADPRLTVDAVAHWGYGCWQPIRSWARHRRLDVLDLQYQTAAYGMSPWIHLLPGRAGPAPLVVTFHDLRYPYLFPKAGPLRPWLVRRLARKADGVIATNPEDYAALSSHPHAALIPIGSNIGAEASGPAAIADARTRSGAAQSDQLVVYFGLLNRSKGLDHLVSAVASLRNNGVPVHLAIIGSAGSSDPTNQAYEAELRARVAADGLSPCVTFTGFLPEREVDALLRAADVVALPFLDGASYRRGSLMAALGAGCAIVTTTPAVRSPGLDDGLSMRFVAPGDATALASTLRDVLDDADLRARLRTGAAEAAERFTWPAIAAATAEFLALVTADGPAR